jgi:hypothetical protein
MYFFKKSNKQYLDLKGNLILSHNDKLIKARHKSSGPFKCNNAKYAFNITKLNTYKKIKLSFTAVFFIWSKSMALEIDETPYREPFRN